MGSFHFNHRSQEPQSKEKCSTESTMEKGIITHGYKLEMYCGKGGRFRFLSEYHLSSTDR